MASSHLLSASHNEIRASHSMKDGDFSDFSTINLPDKPIKWCFSGIAPREKGDPTPLPAPTALRPQATCPTCHSGICNDVLPPFVATARPIVTLPPPPPHPSASAVAGKCDVSLLLVTQQGCGLSHSLLKRWMPLA